MSIVMLFVGICSFVFVLIFLFNELGCKEKVKEIKMNKEKENIELVEKKPIKSIVMSSSVEEMINRAKKDN